MAVRLGRVFAAGVATLPGDAGTAVAAGANAAGTERQAVRQRLRG
jgi:hypothetical protein